MYMCQYKLWYLNNNFYLSKDSEYVCYSPIAYPEK